MIGIRRLTHHQRALHRLDRPPIGPSNKASEFQVDHTPSYINVVFEVSVRQTFKNANPNSSSFFKIDLHILNRQHIVTEKVFDFISCFDDKMILLFHITREVSTKNNLGIYFF